MGSFVETQQFYLEMELAKKSYLLWLEENDLEDSPITSAAYICGFRNGFHDVRRI
jgi:hypothetical protein